MYLSLGTPMGPCALNTCLRRTPTKYKKGAGHLFHDYKHLWARYNELHVTLGGDIEQFWVLQCLRVSKPGYAQGPLRLKHLPSPHSDEV